MRDDTEVEATLRARFAALRAGDAREAPAFGPMFARARAAASAASGDLPSIGAVPSRHRVWRWAAVAAPLAVAASLTAVWLAPTRSADREFERVVSEWSRTERAMTTPTDGLLAVPGSEYLRRLPAFPVGAGATRRPS